MEQYFERGRDGAGPPLGPLSQRNQLHRSTLGACLTLIVEAVSAVSTGVWATVVVVVFSTEATELAMGADSSSVGIGRPCFGLIESHPTKGQAPVYAGFQ